MNIAVEDNAAKAAIRLDRAIPWRESIGVRIAERIKKIPSLPKFIYIMYFVFSSMKK